MTCSTALFDRVVGLPEGEGLRGAARRVLCALAYFADRGVKDPPQEWLAGWAHVTRRHVVDVLAYLAAEGWTSRADSRSAYGRIQRTIYTILECRLVGRADWAAELERARAEAIPCEIEPSHRLTNSHGSGEKMETGTSRISHGDVYKERAHVYARPSLSILPDFESWNWPSEEVRAQARQVLNLCGPGLADVADNPTRLAELFHSLATVLSGTWAQFDFQRIVLTVVARKTAKPRPRHKGLRAFYPLTENMIQEQDAVASRERARMALHVSKPADYRKVSGATKAGIDAGCAAPSLDGQIDRLRRAVERMERGEFGPWDIPSSERSDFYGSESERAAVCERALATEREKLERLGAASESQLGQDE